MAEITIRESLFGYQKNGEEIKKFDESKIKIFFENFEKILDLR